VVDLHDKRNLVRVATRHRGQHAERGGHTVAAAFDGELDDVLGIEINRVGCKRGAAGMFHALIHRQQGKIAGIRQPSVTIKGLQAAQHAGLAVFHRHHAIHIIRPGRCSASWEFLCSDAPANVPLHPPAVA